MLKIKIAILIVLFALTGYCKLNRDNDGTNGDGGVVPIPSITSVLPSAIFAGSPSFTLYINGQDFAEDAVVFINQKLRTPTTVSGVTVTCTIGPEDWNGTLDVAVGNPAEAGGTLKFSNQVAVPILTEGKITFTTPIQIAALTSKPSDYQDIETDNRGNLYVLYQDTLDSVGEVFLVHSPDYGETWGLPVNVSDTGGYSDLPDLAVAPGGDLFVCWWEADDANVEESAIYFSRSTDNGATWENPGHVLPAYTRCSDPRIHIDSGGAVNMVFSNREGQYNTPYFYFARSTDNGGTWNVVRVGEGAEMVQYPLEEDGNGVFHTAYVTYNDGLSGYDLYYARSADRGFTWTSRMISHEISVFRGHVFPSVGFSGGTLYAAWNYDYSHRSGARRVAYFSRSLDGGEVWGPEIQMDETVYNCGGDKADMVVDSRGNIFLVMSYQHVFLARSSDSGQTWTPPMFIKESELHSHPCMTIDNRDNLFIAWSDNGKFYFCRNETPLLLLPAPSF